MFRERLTLGLPEPINGDPSLLPDLMLQPGGKKGVGAFGPSFLSSSLAEGQKDLECDPAG